MKNFRVFILSCCFAVECANAWAGGAVAAVRQKQMMEQEAYIRAVQEEYVRRQQAEAVQQYAAAYQQAAIAQYVEAQKQAIAMAAAQQQMAAQYMAQQMAQEIAMYKQAVIQRQQMLAQQQMFTIKVAQNAQIQQFAMASQARQYVQQASMAQAVAASQQQRFNEYRQALVEKAISDKVTSDQIQAIQGAKTMRDAQDMMAFQAYQMQDQNRMYEDVPSSFVKDVVGVSELWESLDKSGKAWRLIIDKKAKGVTVKHYIDELAKEGGVIRKDPLFYAQSIDDMSRQNPQMLDQPFKDVLRIVAIIDYDYDNGMDKDVLARKIFNTEQSFQANKARLKGQ